LFFNLVFHQLILKSNKALGHTITGMDNTFENIKNMKHDIMAYETETAKYKYQLEKNCNKFLTFSEEG
jgi:hypothetical protein